MKKDKIDTLIKSTHNGLDGLLKTAHNGLDGSSSPFNKAFYQKHLGKVIFVLFLLYSHVQMRYTYEEVIADISALKQELADVRYTSIATWGELTSKNKPEIVRSKISSKANLILADEPPIVVE